MQPVATTLLLIFPLLSACTSMPETRADQLAPRFLTHINGEGSKRFIFEAVPDEQAPRGLSAAQQERLQKQRESLQQALLTQMLASRQYCREGYLVLSQNSWKVRGECNETATEADRLAFPNSTFWQN